jgi:hypothetical protein
MIAGEYVTNGTPTTYGSVVIASIVAITAHKKAKA